jgi:hypothetical protein
MFFFFISKEVYKKHKGAPLSIQKVYKNDTKTGKKEGREEKHPKNPKTGTKKKSQHYIRFCTSHRQTVNRCVPFWTNIKNCIIGTTT